MLELLSLKREYYCKNACRRKNVSPWFHSFSELWSQLTGMVRDELQRHQSCQASHVLVMSADKGKNVCVCRRETLLQLCIRGEKLLNQPSVQWLFGVEVATSDLFLLHHHEVLSLMSWQMLDGLPWNTAQTFMLPSGSMGITLVIPWRCTRQHFYGL